VLVRVFYALGDSGTPFKISMVNIFLNALFDYFLLPLGIQGLVFATVSVNILSVIALVYFLNRKLNRIAWRSWGAAICGLTLASMMAGFASWGVLTGLQNWLGMGNFVIQVVELCIAGGAGLGLFGLIASQMKLPEMDLFVGQMRRRLGR
jgi:putative peptidoglycan lipid II flippase